MAHYDDTADSKVFLIGIVGFLSTALVVLFAQGFYYWLMDSYKVSRTVENQVPLVELEKQQAALNNYVLLDPAKKRYGIPIDKAIEETLSELKTAKPPATAALNK